MVVRFQSPLPFAWAHVPKQGVVAKELELAEMVGFSFFFQNVTNVALLEVPELDAGWRGRKMRGQGLFEC